mmetsp:Transcript_3751/g.6396  ORF Transcript_3751/g.6396 Transcript_3751/m.6396 type:complete len:222 (+) Transcript_3751:489-1154(+)
MEEDESEQLIEHSFMLLSNISALDIGQKHLLGLEGDQKSKFIIAESIFGMSCYFSKNKSFDFVSNIMANLACLEEGRNFMIEHKYIEAIVVQMVTKFLNQHRRKYLIQCIRNLLFEFTTHEEKFLEMNVARDICKVLIDEQGITEDKLPDAWKIWKAKQVKSESDIDYHNTAHMIDALVLLTNSDKLLRRMHEIDVNSVLTQIRFPQEPQWEDVTLRIQVI